MASIRCKICLPLIVSIVLVYNYFNTVLNHNWYARHASVSTTTSLKTPRVPCSDVSDYNWTILLTVNDGYYDFFSNWFWHYERLGINVPIVIIAEDDVVNARLVSQFPSNCNNPVTVHVDKSELHAPTESLGYGTGWFKKFVSARPVHILKYLQKGMNVFYSDIDTVWLQNPFPYFNGTYDMWIGQEKGRIYCTGFMAITSNNKTMKLMKDWTIGLDKSLQINQPLFNTILKASKVKFKPLNETIFPSGKSFNNFTVQDRSNVVVFHNTYVIQHIHKLERFKKLNLWFESF